MNFQIFLLLAILNLALGSSEITQNHKIHPALVNSFESTVKINVIISFVGGNEEALKSFKSLSSDFKTRGDKLTGLKGALTQHASYSQSNVKKFLEAKNVPFKSFWISNQIFIKNARLELVEALSTFPEVEDVREEGKVKFEAVLGNKWVSLDEEEEVLWNIKKIKADQAWEITNGSGIVVGVLDTGMRASHEALRDSFRGVEEYGWIDVVDGKAVPYDDKGHGSHVAGSIAGGKGIGGAPGAKLMACQSCPGAPHEGRECFQSSMIACMEWFLCPTLYNGSNPDCSKAPNVVSNSWGYEPGSTSFEQIVNAWIEADIVPVFSAGNADKGRCNVVISPSDIPAAISVCSTNVNDYQSELSSSGPATNHDEIKPEICAPGQEILSVDCSNDSGYTEMSGTSMSAPHVSSVIALMLSAAQNKNKTLTVAEVKGLLLSEGVDTNLRSKNRNCGGIPDTQFPNYVFGYGRADALKAVQAVMNM